MLAVWHVEYPQFLAITYGHHLHSYRGTSSRQEPDNFGSTCRSVQNILYPLITWVLLPVGLWWQVGPVPWRLEQLSRDWTIPWFHNRRGSFVVVHLLSICRRIRIRASTFPGHRHKTLCLVLFCSLATRRICISRTWNFLSGGCLG